MYQINHLPPERMTSEQRCRELASLLANGLVRLRSHGTGPSTGSAEESEFGLGFSGKQRVHRDTVNKTTMESK